jgi:hypothetical protein
VGVIRVALSSSQITEEIPVDNCTCTLCQQTIVHYDFSFALLFHKKRRKKT